KVDAGIEDPGKLFDPMDCLESNLMILSIETVKPRNTTDLSALFKNAKIIQAKTNRDIAGATWGTGTEEKKGGWVIAVHGYTTHFGRTNFIIASLGNNLAASFGIRQKFTEVKSGKPVLIQGGTPGGAKPGSGAPESDGDGALAGKVQNI